MTKREIGFIHGTAENPDRTWKREINGTVYTFKKAREKSFFLYSCQCESEDARFIRRAATGFHSDRDLTPAEVEQLPQFDHFIQR